MTIHQDFQVVIFTVVVFKKMLQLEPAFWKSALMMKISVKMAKFGIDLSVIPKAGSNLFPSMLWQESFVPKDLWIEKPKNIMI